MEKKKNDYVEIKLPRFIFKNASLNVFLVFVLIIFSFLLGMLTHRLFYLEALAKVKGATTETQETISPSPAVVKNLDKGNLAVLGEKQAKVTVIEFSDFQCPYCQKYVESTHKQLKETYIDTGKISFAFRHYPLQFHQFAITAAEATNCANEQNKFWEYHDALFANQGTWSSMTEATAVTDAFTEYATNVGLNAEQFNSCLTSEKYKQQVMDDLAAGEKAGVTGTPTFFINGRMVVGAVPFSELQTIIEEELKK